MLITLSLLLGLKGLIELFSIFSTTINFILTLFRASFYKHGIT